MSRLHNFHHTKTFYGTSDDLCSIINLEKFARKIIIKKFQVAFSFKKK